MKVQAAGSNAFVGLHMIIYRFRIMDNTAGFYPANMGSIPVGGANSFPAVV